MSIKFVPPAGFTFPFETVKDVFTYLTFSDGGSGKNYDVNNF